MKPSQVRYYSLLGVLFLMLGSITQRAVAQKYDWSKLDGKGAHGWNITSWGSGAQDMVCDEYGNIYSIGAILGPQYAQSNGTLDFGDSVYASSPAGQYITPYIVKYNRRGNALWAKAIESTGYLYTTAVAIDTAGNSYIIGSTWNGSVTSIAGQTVNAYGSGDIWLVKVKPDGNIDWAMTVGGNLQDYPTGITCSANGDVYITGLFQGYFQYGNTGISGSSNGWSVFLLKLATTGTPYYCRRIATTSGTDAWQSAGGDVETDRFGNVYVSGSFTGTIQSGSGLLSAGSSTADQNGFVMKVLPSNGTPLWAKQMGSTASALSVDENGFLYAGGKMQAGADSFGTYRLTTTGGLGFDDLYIARLSNTGALSWVKRFGDNNATNTNPGWWWANQRINIASMDVDFAGKIFVSGTIDRTTDTLSICQFYVPPFSNTTWSGVYSTDAFLLKIDPSGTTDWSARSGIRKKAAVVTWYEEKSNGGGVSTDNAGATYWKSSRTWAWNTTGDTAHLFFNNDTNKVAEETELSYYTPVLWAIREQWIEIDSFTPEYVCPGDTIKVWYSKHDPFLSGNEFSIKLSNRGGNFYDALEIGKITDTGAGVITGVIPLTTLVGNGYRLRVDGTTPAIRGYPFEKSLKVRGVPPTNAGKDDSLCYGDTLTLTAKGGFRFAWFNDVFLSDTSLISPKAFPDSTHRFIVRSEDSVTKCYYLDTVQIRVISHPTLIPRDDTTICQGESVWLHTLATGGKPMKYHYTWIDSNTGIVQGNGDSLFVSPRITTPYKVVLYDSCSIIRDTATITVNVRGHVQATPRPDTTLCIGEAVNVYATPQGGLATQYGYKWYIDTNLVSTDSAFVFPSQDTTVIFKLVVDDGGCSDEMDSAYFKAIRRDSIKIFTRSDTTICNGQGILLNAFGTGGFEGGYTFTWDHNLPSNDSVFVVPTQFSTNYKVSLTDGCTNFIDTASITINLRFPLTIKVQQDTLICRGESLLLHVDGTGGDSLHYTFDWKYLGYGNNIKVTPSVSTTYYVTLTDNCTLLSTDDSVRVTLRSPLDITTSPDTTICVANTALLRAYGTGGNVPTYEFIWNDGTTETTLPAGTPYAVTPTANKTYSVRLQDNCTVKKDSALINVTLRDPLSVSTIPSDTVICHGAIATLRAQGSGGLVGNYSYFWANIGNGSTKQVQPLVDSSFMVIMSDGCSPWDTAYVQVNIATPLQVAGFGDTLVCPEKIIPLKASGSGGISSAYTYTWSHALGTGTAKFVAPGTDQAYVITLSDNCSFAARDTVYVTMAALPATVITADVDSACQPALVNFSSNHVDAGGFSNWSWYFEGKNIENTGVNQATYLYSKPGNYSVKAIITSSYGCVDSTNYVELVIHPKPVAIFTFNPESTTIVEPPVHMVNTSTQSVKYLWDFGDGGSSILPSPGHTYKDTGHYPVVLYVESNYGCKDTLGLIHHVREIYSCYVPSAFTPNGDKVNDDFYVVGTGVKKLHIQIWDRWGALIYESDDPKFRWDGSTQRGGNALPTGAYVYRIKVDLENGGREIINGTISLVR